MGIDVNSLRFVLYARSCGVDFSQTAMIGRLGLYLSHSQLRDILTKEFGYDINAETLRSIYSQKYADGLLRFLGADVVHSFDYSEYEGATHIHDFNRAIPNEFLGQYTAVIEGGTLEHIFNFPTAIKNCMKMIKPGGHYLGSSPTNNYMGHGFYQFSPELYFRVFCRSNGFRVERIVLHDWREKAKWFSVIDPDRVKRRITLRNCTPTSLLILAKRLADCPIFLQFPLQSDYVYVWNDPRQMVKTNVVQEWSLPYLAALVPKTIRKRIRALVEPRPNPAFFEPFDPLESAK